MGAFLLLLPAALSLLVLGAHFLRSGNVVITLVCLALVVMLWVRRPWVSRTVQVALLLGAAEWVRTLMTLIPGRIASGEAWGRMAVILGMVAAVAVLGALLMEHAAIRRRFGRLPGPPGA